jgi:hypothetical protein
MPLFEIYAFAYHPINVLGVVHLVTKPIFCLYGGQYRMECTMLAYAPSALEHSLQTRTPTSKSPCIETYALSQISEPTISSACRSPRIRNSAHRGGKWPWLHPGFRHGLQLEAEEAQCNSARTDNPKEENRTADGRGLTQIIKELCLFVVSPTGLAAQVISNLLKSMFICRWPSPLRSGCVHLRFNSLSRITDSA